MTLQAAARQLLRDAAWLIGQPGCWCQGSIAKDIRGAHIGGLNPNAVSWCGWGAVVAISKLDGLPPYAAADLFYAHHDDLLQVINDRVDMTARKMARLMLEAADG